MELKTLKALLGLLLFVTFTAPSLAQTRPHFYIQMENRSDKAASVSFQTDIGNVYLNPTLSTNTPLAAQEKSKKYEVHIEPLDDKSTFNIVFTGKKPCTFNIGYYAPANPKVTVIGPGCYGGGYQIIDKGYTLLLYISDIHKA